MTAAAALALVAAPFVLQLVGGWLLWNHNGRPAVGLIRGGDAAE